jgi:hypothetical protein
MIVVEISASHKQFSVFENARLRFFSWSLRGALALPKTLRAAQVRHTSLILDRLASTLRPSRVKMELFDFGRPTHRMGDWRRLRLSPVLMRTPGDSKDFPVKTGEGRLVAEPGSDASVLLSDHKRALEAKASPVTVQRARTLPFTFVNLGENPSQAPSGGGFNQDPPGDWTAIKIFIGEGDQEGEVFLNFNQTIGKGQFSIKDPDYGDLVLKQLATVL